MYTINSLRRSGIPLVVGAMIAMSSGLLGAQQRPALRPLGAVAVVSPAFRSISAIRVLPGAGVLLNDPGSRQLLLLDSTLHVIRVVADTTEATHKAYGNGGALLAFRGDSSLFVSDASLSMLVLDAHGKVCRVMAAPRPQDISALTGGIFGKAGFDADGRLVYRNVFNSVIPPLKPDQPSPGPQFADSAPVVRFNFATRQLDTAAFTRVQGSRTVFVQDTAGDHWVPVIDPVPLVDDWAIRPDGVIAILRKDYHVDFIDGHDVKTSGPLIPFDWHRLSDSDKVALVDTLKASIARSRATPPPAGMTPLGVNPQAGGAPAYIRQSQNAPPPVRVLPAKDLPDYYAAFATGSMQADADGNLWVRTIPREVPAPNGPEYDVIDGSGKLVDRVLIPKGSTIIGVGPQHAVYLGVRDSAGVHLVRAQESTGGVVH